ncbi:hypothetical protein DM02DRAFT_310627 [Periconia macrospinosa]|uniref:Uncharacterized protein n=1 Tax=Periconia macrospinosa TaxID=97972 RepID=A0A2V1DV56_9PLEO|nr:hypothetical protein DM02DRAFT_310627 [Periconia macrospinosa]
MAPAHRRFFSLDREIAQVEFNKSIAGSYRDGNAEYDAVGVLLLTWREDDLKCKEKEVNVLENVFKTQFNFNTEQYEIPPIDSQKSLLSRLQAFIRCYDSPSKLGIIYYGGHAHRTEAVDGVDLELFARRRAYEPTKTNISRNNTSLTDISLPASPQDSKPAPIDSQMAREVIDQPRISFKAIYEQLKHSETDTLLIVDSCFAAGAFVGQPFGGRKCELFCSIAEGEWARAPGEEGSFTTILMRTLQEMIRNFPGGFSTSDLYREIYHQQHRAHKPFHFIQSRYDFGRIWLRPCRVKDPASQKKPVESEYSIDVRFHFSRSLDVLDLNKVVKTLQHIPYVQLIKMQKMHGPNDTLADFIRLAYLANRLRPVLARVRRKLELKRARQLCSSDSSPPSPSSRSTSTSERFHVQEPRDVELFDWSNAQAVTPRKERLTSDQYFEAKKPKFVDLKLSFNNLKKHELHAAITNAAPQVFDRGTREQDTRVNVSWTEPCS